jgi:CheY-like chemotaxis protein
MARIVLASSDASLLSSVTKGLSAFHEIHWLSLGDALDRCRKREADALIVDLDSGSVDIGLLRDCIMEYRVPVIIVGRDDRGQTVARSLGGVFFERRPEMQQPDALPETIWSFVLLDAMRLARRHDGPAASSRLRKDEAARGTILVVDDDDAIRLALRDLLEAEGYTVVPASDGSEALELLRSGAVLPSLILLDLMMPGTNGWQVRAALRTDPRLSKIPIAVISAAQPPAKALADWYLKKPIDVDQLLRTIDGFLMAS